MSEKDRGMSHEQEILEAEFDAQDEHQKQVAEDIIDEGWCEDPANPDLGEPMDSNPKTGESRIEQDLIPPDRTEAITVEVAGKMVEIPIVLGWKVLMRPKRAKTSTDWGFELDSGMTMQEAYATYVSQVLAVGEGCFKARDQGGVDMNKFTLKPEPGDWVIHSPYVGYRIRMRGMGEIDYLIVMDDTEIHCIVNNPDDYYGVIDVSSR